MISQRATWLRTHAGAAAHTTSGGRGQVVMFPLFHMAGWNFATMAWSAHQPAHLVRRADADELLGAVERWSAATLYCIPAVWRRILECDRPADVSSLDWALTGTSQVTTELLTGIKERFPSSPDDGQLRLDRGGARRRLVRRRPVLPSRQRRPPHPRGSGHGGRRR